ncbi:hypothetical protein [Haloprofundus salilacus]|uniref:hypothetical protein n=1 Tax=Haloprofundus salilacus TaxID=2876190 RepID=UPI001CCAA80F|nr:hypothetical protein [Haloprofundus salilacus]
MNKTKHTTTKTTNEIEDDLSLAGRQVEYTDDAGDVHCATIRGTLVEGRDCTRVLLGLEDGERVETTDDHVEML